MAAIFTLNTSELAAQLNALRADGLHAAKSTVQLWSKRMVKKLAWATNYAKIPHRHRGRLRAGWYPAADLLKAGGVYAGTYRNHGEGGCIDLSADPMNPRVIMWNSVTFWPHVEGLTQNLQQAVDELTRRASAELEGDFSRFSGQIKKAG